MPEFGRLAQLGELDSERFSEFDGPVPRPVRIRGFAHLVIQNPQIAFKRREIVSVIKILGERGHERFVDGDCVLD